MLFYADGDAYVAVATGIGGAVTDEDALLAHRGCELLVSRADVYEDEVGFGWPVGEADFVAGQITELYLRHYGVELYRDIEAWGGSLQTSFPDSVPLLVSGRSNAIMRENTSRGPAGFAAQMAAMRSGVKPWSTMSQVTKGP